LLIPRLRGSTAKGADTSTNAVDQAPAPASYPLQGWIFCICGQAFHRWGRIDATREYLSLCGCRLWPLDASTIERRVYAAVALAAPGLIGDGWTDRPAEVLARLFTRVEVGGTVEDIRLVPRT
jgi:hypothetical protein